MPTGKYGPGYLTTDVFMVYTNGIPATPGNPGIPPTPVAAKYLTDNNGNYIIDPNPLAGGMPYVVPADYNLNATIAKYTAIGQMDAGNGDGNGGTGGSNLFQVMAIFYQNFHTGFPGSPDDLQRYYNGSAATEGGFVSAFTDAASFNLGIAGAAAGQPQGVTIAGGGGQNYRSSLDGTVNSSGPLGNVPINATNIESGYNFISRGVASPDPTVTISNGWQNSGYPGGVITSVWIGTGAPTGTNIAVDIFGNPLPDSGVVGATKVICTPDGRGGYVENGVTPNGLIQINWSLGADNSLYKTSSTITNQIDGGGYSQTTTLYQNGSISGTIVVNQNADGSGTVSSDGMNSPINYAVGQIPSIDPSGNISILSPGQNGSTTETNYTNSGTSSLTYDADGIPLSQTTITGNTSGAYTQLTTTYQNGEVSGTASITQNADGSGTVTSDGLNSPVTYASGQIPSVNSDGEIVITSPTQNGSPTTATTYTADGSTSVATDALGNVLSTSTLTGSIASGTYTQTTVTNSADGPPNTAVITAIDGSGTVSLNDGTPVQFSSDQTPSINAVGQPVITAPDTTTPGDTGGTIQTTLLPNGSDTVVSNSSGQTLTDTVLTGDPAGAYNSVTTIYQNGETAGTVVISQNADGSGSITSDGLNAPISYVPGQTPSVNDSGQPVITTPVTSGNNSEDIQQTTYTTDGTNTIVTGTGGTVLSDTTLTGNVNSGTYTQTTVIDNPGGSTTTDVIAAIDGSGTATENSGTPIPFVSGQTPSVAPNGNIDLSATDTNGLMTTAVISESANGSGTISENGGTPISFFSGQTPSVSSNGQIDLSVANSNGSTTTAVISESANGSGTISENGGTPIPFTTGQTPSVAPNGNIDLSATDTNGLMTTAVISESANGSGTISENDGALISFSNGQTPNINSDGQIVITGQDTSGSNPGGTQQTTNLGNDSTETVITNASGGTISDTTQTVTQNPDGSSILEVTDPQGDMISETATAGTTTQNGDGSTTVTATTDKGYVETTTRSDGEIYSSWANLDGSGGTSSTMPGGDRVTRAVTADGVQTNTEHDYSTDTYYTWQAGSDGTTILTSGYDDGNSSTITTQPNGSSVMTGYFPDGSISNISVENVDGSENITDYSDNGPITSTYVLNADGSSESKNYYPDGSVSRSSNKNADGSSDSTDYYGESGSVWITNYQNVDGTWFSTSYSSDGKIEATWTGNPDGSGIITLYNPDGSVAGGDASGQWEPYSPPTPTTPPSPPFLQKPPLTEISSNFGGYIDIQTFYINGLTATDVLTETNGTVYTLNYSFNWLLTESVVALPDDSTTSSEYYPNGIVSSIEFQSSNGSDNIVDYDAIGDVASDSWLTITGSYGTTTFNANGSSSGSTHNANGTYSTFTNNGQGNLVTTNFNASGVMTSTVNSSTIGTFAGNAVNDSLTGSSNLSVSGNGLNDVITGNAGNDTLQAGTGNDTLQAGTGNDTLIGSAIGETTYVYNSDAPVTTITNSSVGDVLSFASAGIPNRNYITASYSIVNGVPVTTLNVFGGGGSIVIDGNALPQLSYPDGTTTNLIETSGIFGAGVSNALLVGSIDLSVTGNNLNDVITGNSGSDVLQAGTGNDTLFSGTGNNTLIGGSGVTTYAYNSNAGNTVIEQSGSSDVLSFGIDISELNITTVSTLSSGVPVTMLDIGGGGQIAIIGGGLTQLSFANGTTATLTSVGGPLPSTTSSVVLIGSSNLAVTGNSVSDVIIGNSGNDTLQAGSGNDTLISGSGNDTLIGGSGQTTYVYNGTGDTTIMQFGNTDTLMFGAGVSVEDITAVVSTATGSPVSTFNINGGGQVIVDGNVSRVQFVNGSTLPVGALVPTLYTSSNAVLPANYVNLVLTGNADLMGTGNSSPNVITGNYGNDTLIAGSGIATLIGGDNNDASCTFVVNNASDVIEALEVGAGHSNSVESSVSWQLENYVFQNLTLTGSANLTGTGNNLDDVITGNTGNDTLIAGSGNDTLIGGGGTAIYELNQGTNSVTIENSANTDILQFGIGIRANDLTAVETVGANGLSVVTLNEANGGSVVIDGGALSQVDFADGSSTTLAQLVATTVASTPSGSGLPPGTTSLSSSQSIVAPAGIVDLTLTGNANITATGNSLNDVIQANGGWDTLIAGSGNDTLIGGYDGTTFMLGTDSGVTTIDTICFLDTLSFGTGIEAGDLTAVVDVEADGSTTLTIQDSQGNAVVIPNYLIGLADTLSFADGSTSSLSAILAQTSLSTSQSVIMPAGIQDLSLTGSGNLSATGNSLNDVIQANSGNDTLIAGDGNDTLVGGGGANTYVVGTSSGLTTIDQAGDADTLSFGSGIMYSDLSAAVAYESNGSMTFTIQNSQGNAVVINNYTSGMVDNLGFADGSTGSLSALLAQSTLSSSQSVVMPAGFQGLILTGSGNLTATGNTQNDLIQANNGLDTLIAGSGNDTLLGNYNNTTYVVGAGSGVTTISQAGISDNITFGAGIDPGDLSATAAIGAHGVVTLTIQDTQGNPVVIDVYTIGSSITLNFADGSGESLAVLLAQSMSGATATRSSSSMQLPFPTQNLTLLGNADLSATGNYLNDVITANSGDDTLTAGSSNDTLIAGSGNDTLIGAGAGSGWSTTYEVGTSSGVTTIEQGWSADILSFGTGIATGDLSASATTATDGSTTVTILDSQGNAVVIDDYISGIVDQLDFADGSTASLSALLTPATNGITAMSSSDSTVMPAGIQSLILTGSADLIAVGNSLSGVITANSGNDTLIAGYAGDTLVGGSGTTTYLVGDISNANATIANSSGTDTLEFGFAIAESDIIATSAVVNGVTVTTLTDSVAGFVVTIQGGGLNQVNFLDGGSTTLGQLLASSHTDGTTLYSTVSVAAPAGITTIDLSGSANLSAIANSLNDVIQASGGNDTLVAGSGNDTLIGGAGTNTYVVGVGSGVTTINQVEGNTTDILSFGAGISASNLTATILDAANGSSTVTIQDSQGNAVVINGLSSTLGQISFADGSTMSMATLLKQGGAVTTNADGSYSIYSSDGNGDTTTTAYGVNGNVLGDSWTQSNGTYGTDTISGGTESGNAYNADGSYSSYNSSGGNMSATDFSSTNSVIGSASQQNSGWNGLITDNADGSSVGEFFGPDGSYGNDTVGANGDYAEFDYSANGTLIDSYTQTTNGTITYENYGSSGNTLNSTWINADGSSGLDAFNSDGSISSSTFVAGSSIDTLVGGAGNDTFIVNDPGDVVQAQAGANNTIETSVSYAAATNVQTLEDVGGGGITLTGNNGNDLIVGNVGSDTLVSGSGVDVLEAIGANNVLEDTGSATAMIGGTGNDTMTGGSGSDFIAGGAGNDAITLGAGTAVVAFNTGAATIAAGTGLSNVLSLGGGISYDNLSFSKSGDNLILNTGGNNAITFTNWYAGTADQNFVTLQVIEQAASTYSSSSTNVLYNEEVEDFSFTQLVSAFNAALTATPTLTSWSLSNALLTDHLSGSNTAALGGDLAYYDGLNGNLTGMNLATAVTTLGSSTYGKTAQTIDAWSGISAGSNRLH